MAKQLRLGVGLWCVSFASDRFVGGGYRPMRSLEEQIKIVLLWGEEVDSLPDAEECSEYYREEAISAFASQRRKR